MVTSTQKSPWTASPPALTTATATEIGKRQKAANSRMDDHETIAALRGLCFRDLDGSDLRYEFIYLRIPLPWNPSLLQFVRRDGRDFLALV